MSGDGHVVVRETPDRAWLPVLRRYLVLIAGANLVWELLHLPLYTIWFEGSGREIVFAALHCTAGDILIAGASLILALLIIGDRAWPKKGYAKVAGLTITFGLAYTVFSEWLNISVRESWAYSDLMPVVPFIDAGLSPVAQWIVIPFIAFWWARRCVASHSEETR